jgi:1-acyl-sn-glycerol-3-phosphate acyltransferase
LLDTFMTRVAAPFIRLWLHPKVEGADLVPLEGRLIVASNHLSFIDSFLIPLAVLPRRVTTLTKAEYFERPGIKGAFYRWFFAGMGYVPIRRGTGRAALDALDQAKEIVASERAFLLYPEGTRSDDGRLYRGRPGIGAIVLGTGATVLPIGIVGSDKMQPMGKKFPSPFARVTVRIGQPMEFGQYAGDPPGRARRMIADEVVQAIQKLSGQEYAGVYNDRAPT